MSFDFIKKLEERGQRTPDFSELRAYNNILVFVYCNLKRNRQHHNLMNLGKYVGRAITASNTFTLKHISGVPIGLRRPFAFKCVSSASRGKIGGEVYAITPVHLLMLDLYQRNTDETIREQQHIHLIDQEPILKSQKYPVTLPCFMWIGNAAQGGENKENLHLSAYAKYTGTPKYIGRNRVFNWHGY